MPTRGLEPFQESFWRVHVFKRAFQVHQKNIEKWSWRDGDNVLYSTEGYKKIQAGTLFRNAQSTNFMGLKKKMAKRLPFVFVSRRNVQKPNVLIITENRVSNLLVCVSKLPSLSFQGSNKTFSSLFCLSNHFKSHKGGGVSSGIRSTGIISMFLWPKGPQKQGNHLPMQFPHRYNAKQ